MEQKIPVYSARSFKNVGDGIYITTTSFLRKGNFWTKSLIPTNFKLKKRTGEVILFEFVTVSLLGEHGRPVNSVYISNTGEIVIAHYDEYEEFPFYMPKFARK